MLDKVSILIHPIVFYWIDSVQTNQVSNLQTCSFMSLHNLYCSHVSAGGGIIAYCLQFSYLSHPKPPMCVITL